jgi:hypothetical protein
VDCQVSSRRKYWRTGWPSIAAGVGNKDNPLTQMRGAKGCRREHVPLRIIPDLGQVPKNSVEASAEQRLDVFHDRVPRS